jgi:hypothetical protein
MGSRVIFFSSSIFRSKLKFKSPSSFAKNAREGWSSAFFILGSRRGTLSVSDENGNVSDCRAQRGNAVKPLVVRAGEGSFALLRMTS